MQYSLTKTFRNYVYKVYSFNYSVAVLLMLFYKILFIVRVVATDRLIDDVTKYSNIYDLYLAVDVDYVAVTMYQLMNRFIRAIVFILESFTST